MDFPLPLFIAVSTLLLVLYFIRSQRREAARLRHLRRVEARIHGRNHYW